VTWKQVLFEVFVSTLLSVAIVVSMLASLTWR
jgi:hypothetical protein